jgi:hypothetical protein
MSFQFDSKEFFKLTEGVLPIGGTRSTITLTVNGKLEVETEGECGEYHWQIPCTTTGKYDDKATELVFTMKFLTDALRSYAGEGPVTVEVPQTYGAVLINRHAIVMPIRK